VPFNNSPIRDKIGHFLPKNVTNLGQKMTNLGQKNDKIGQKKWYKI